MKVEKGKLYAIITGDIVGSSRLPQSERVRLHETMMTGATELRSHFKSVVPMALDIFRGDGWQLVVTAPHRALAAGLLYRAHIRFRMKSKRLDTRVAIGVGTIDFLPDQGVSGGDGEAFRISGAALESLSKNSWMKFDCAARDESWISAVDTVVQLIDAIAMEWTEAQAQAVAGSLQGWKQERIASSWWQGPISQQAVAQHLDRARWNAVERGIRFFEQRLSEPAGHDD